MTLRAGRDEEGPPEERRLDREVEGRTSQVPGTVTSLSPAASPA
jgi:hypothetical protein